MHSYQEQDSDLSFAEGLAEYYAAYPELKRGRDLAPAAADFFRCHDAVHVIYGCDTSLKQEAVVKLSSFAGTSEGLGVMKGYALYDSLDIYRSLSPAEIGATIAAAPLLIPRVLMRCSRQTRKWPWRDFETFLSEPLSETRRAFGITVWLPQA